MTRFSSATDKYKANIIAPDKVWGNARVLYKIDHGDWISVYAGETKAELVSANKVVYTDYEKGMPIKMERTLEKVGKGIDFTIKLQAMMEYPLTIGNFEIPLPNAPAHAASPRPLARTRDTNTKRNRNQFLSWGRQDRLFPPTSDFLI